MKQEDVMRLAREAGWKYADGDDGYEPLWKFAELILASDRRRTAWSQDHWLQYEHDIADAEREACAELLISDGWLMAATLIRTRKPQ